MSNDKKKAYCNVSMRLDKEIWEAFKARADKLGQKYTVAVERVLKAVWTKNPIPERNNESGKSLISRSCIV